MARLEVQVRWKAPMLMVGTTDRSSPVLMDTTAESGGSGVGPTPKETVLMALASCTGMDVVGILRKTRAPLEGLMISVSAEQALDHPKVFTRIHLRYTAWGVGLAVEQVTRAVTLSLEKYCSVSAMLRKTADISHEVVVAARAEELAQKPAVA